MDRNSFLSQFTANATAPKTIDVTLDGGQVVRVRKLTQAEVETLSKEYANKTVAGLRYVVCRTMVDESGQRILNDTDTAKLAELDFDVINQIATAASEFSGLAVPKNS